MNFKKEFLPLLFELLLEVDNVNNLEKWEKQVEVDETDLIEKIANKKLWLSNNNEINKPKSIDSILKDIRSNKLGRITWQKYVGE